MVPRDETSTDSGPETAGLVRRLRAVRGLTQEGLARELGVSFATVNGWENGRHRPIPALSRRLAEMAAEDRAPQPATPLAPAPAEAVIAPSPEGTTPSGEVPPPTPADVSR